MTLLLQLPHKLLHICPARTMAPVMLCTVPAAEVWEKRQELNFSVDPVLLHPGYLHGGEKAVKMQNLSACCH